MRGSACVDQRSRQRNGQDVCVNRTTTPKVLFGWSLRDRRLNGHKFVRQFPIGSYFADFACRECQLVVEVDGSQHARNKYDQARDQFMVSNDWSVLRFWNVDVLKERDAVLETILAAIEQRLDRHIQTNDLRFIAAKGYGETCP